MSIAHVISSIAIGTASVALGVWVMRKYGARFLPVPKGSTPSFAEQAKAAKDDVSEKVNSTSRSLADTLLDIERARSGDK